MTELQTPVKARLAPVEVWTFNAVIGYRLKSAVTGKHVVDLCKNVAGYWEASSCLSDAPIKQLVMTGAYTAQEAMRCADRAFLWRPPGWVRFAPSPMKRYVPDPILDHDEDYKGYL